MSVLPAAGCLVRSAADASQYCGEEGDKCELKAALVCSNPFNLEISSKLLQSSFIGKELYLRVMGSMFLVHSGHPWHKTSLADACLCPQAAMKRLIETHKKELQQHTDLDLESVMKITYLHEFDREIQ